MPENYFQQFCYGQKELDSKIIEITPQTRLLIALVIGMQNGDDYKKKPTTVERNE
jgi:hypothetical protein